jgi:hypothetical protein
MVSRLFSLHNTREPLFFYMWCQVLGAGYIF